MNRHSGSAITGMEHLRQSVGDILSTPIGSRVMRRDYGSLVPELLDHPDNQATQVRLLAAVASALLRWEPRLHLTRITVRRDPGTPGRAEMTLEGRNPTTNTWRRQPLTLQVSLSKGQA